MTTNTPNVHVRTVCKIGQGAACCRYLIVDPLGFYCCKLNPRDKRNIDQAWERDDHVAQGTGEGAMPDGSDCEGRVRRALN